MESRGRVLIIEDDETMARFIARVLRVEHEVTIAEDGQAALALLERGERFDLIFCDLQMPRMTGIDFLMNLDQIAADQADRIVFLTGNPSHPMARLIPGNLVMDKTKDCSTLNVLAARLVREARSVLAPLAA